MSKLKVEVEIERAAGEAFAFLVDVANEIHWRDGIVSVTLQNGTMGQVGATYTETISMAGMEIEVGIEVTEVLAGTQVSYTFEGGPLKGRASYEVRAREGGSTVIGLVDLGGGVVAKAMSGLLKTRYEEDFATLKKVLES